jgi:hypothetical protein
MIAATAFLVEEARKVSLGQQLEVLISPSGHRHPGIRKLLMYA